MNALPVVTRFHRPKIVRRSSGMWNDRPVAGYQIRLGRPEAEGPALLELDGEPEGARTGRVWGTSLHGLFDGDEFRTALLAEIAEQSGRSYEPAPTTLAEAFEIQHEKLADWLEDHADVDRLVAEAGNAPPPGAGPGW